jgi:hypothetical protein
MMVLHGRERAVAPRKIEEFLDVEPTVENRWRALVLFGRNSASYKFALGRVLLEWGQKGDELVRLEEIALPYAEAICEHLKASPRQGTAARSKFLDGCRNYNEGKIDAEKLRDITVRDGFVNVIDAFHVLGNDKLKQQFFIDERNSAQAIRLTDHLRTLTAARSSTDLKLENDARWRLVEMAWDIQINKALITYDGAGSLTAPLGHRRVSVTSSRDALNGYQKGHCFYCFAPISIEEATMLADVDHFLPFILREFVSNLNGVWNLVLACKNCNRGPAGKFDLVPEIELLERLHTRNEYLITSHHPLRDALMNQTGQEEHERRSFLNAQYEAAVRARIARWRPQLRGRPVF